MGVDGVEDPEFVFRAGLGRDYVDEERIRSARAMDKGGYPNLEWEHILL